MKTLILILIGFAIAGGMIVESMPELAGVPVLGAVSVWLADAGIGDLPNAIRGSVNDLWQAAADRNLGPLHLGVLIAGLLLARKVLVWLLR